jgi:hypothetical protein
VESPLSIKLLAGEFSRGDSVLVDVEDEDSEELTFSKLDVTSDVIETEPAEV